MAPDTCHTQPGSRDRALTAGATDGREAPAGPLATATDARGPPAGARGSPALGPQDPAEAGAGRGREAAARRTLGYGSEDRRREQDAAAGADRGKDTDGLGAASGSSEPGAGPGVPARKAESRWDGDVGPLRGDKGLTGFRAGCKERGKRTRAGTRAGQESHEAGDADKARLGRARAQPEEARGTCL